MKGHPIYDRVTPVQKNVRDQIKKKKKMCEMNSHNSQLFRKDTTLQGKNNVLINT